MTRHRERVWHIEGDGKYRLMVERAAIELQDQGFEDVDNEPDEPMDVPSDDVEQLLDEEVEGRLDVSVSDED